MQRTDLKDLPPELADAIRETEFITRSYLGGLSFLIQDTARDPSYISNHLLSCLSQAVLQSAVSISALATEGLLNVAKRELRFLRKRGPKGALRLMP
jgi:hypothetical protein